MLEKSTISKIQKYVREQALIRGFQKQTVQERLLILAEEVGELLRAYRKTNKIHTDTKVKRKDANIGEELADILTMLCWTAEGCGLDLESEFIKKEAKNKKRIWKH